MPLDVPDHALRLETQRIYENIREAMVTTPAGASGWVGYDLTDGELVVKGEKGLYSGQLGVALYFGAMYAVFNEDRYRESTYEAVSYLFEQDIVELVDGAGVGVGSGIGAIIYGLSVLAEVTGSHRYRERAEEFLAALSDERIKSDNEYDVLGGVAGAVAGTLRLYEQTRKTNALNKAVRCGEHLLDNRYDKWGYGVWDTFWDDSVQSFSTGMAHGAAGISYSLFRLYGHTGRTGFRDAAHDALDFENVFYSRRNRNWKANWRAIPQYPTWWCYGLFGVGTARLGSLEHYESEVLRRDLDRARDGLEPELLAGDSVCHGTASIIDWLVELGRAVDVDYASQARGLAGEMIRRRRRTGGYQFAHGDLDGLYNPVFFLGTAGIGYTLLRLLDPNGLPSVLRFE